MSLLQWKPGLTRVFDPQADLDYGFDWSDYLDEVPAGDDPDTIATSSWSVSGDDSNLTASGSENDDTTTKIKFEYSGSSTVEADYTVTNVITTVGGRTDARSFIIRVVKR